MDIKVGEGAGMKEGKNHIYITTSTGIHHYAHGGHVPSRSLFDLWGHHRHPRPLSQRAWCPELFHRRCPLSPRTSRLAPTEICIWWACGSPACPRWPPPTVTAIVTVVASLTSTVCRSGMPVQFDSFRSSANHGVRPMLPFHLLC
jgi:hypothetical protein